MTCRTEKLKRPESGWENFERLFPANNNIDPQTSPETHILKRRLEVLQAVEQKIKDLTASRVTDPNPSEVILRVIKIRMSRLKGGFKEFEAVS